MLFLAHPVHFHKLCQMRDGHAAVSACMHSFSQFRQLYSVIKGNHYIKTVPEPHSFAVSSS